MRRLIQQHRPVAQRRDRRRVSVIELVAAGFAGPPLHHHDFDEAFYVLAGELTFQLGNAFSTAGGRLAFARAASTTPREPERAPPRDLLVCTPGASSAISPAARPSATASIPADWALEPRARDDRRRAADQGRGGHYAATPLPVPEGRPKVLPPE